MLLVGASIPVTGLLGDYPVLMGQAWRYGLAAVVLLALMRWRGERHAPLRVSDLGWLVALAVVGMAGFNVLMLAAVQEAEPALVGSVVGAAPLVLALAPSTMRGRLPPAGLLLGAALVVAGVVVTEGAGSGSALGLLLAAGAMVCEVAFTLLAAPVLPRLGAFRVSAYGCALTVPVLGLGALLHSGADLVAPTRTELSALLWLAIVTTALAFVMWYAGVARLGGGRAGLFVGLVPAGALVTTVLLHGGPLEALTVVGVLVAGTGIVVGMLSRPRPGRPRRGL